MYKTILTLSDLTERVDPVKRLIVLLGNRRKIHLITYCLSLRQLSMHMRWVIWKLKTARQWRRHENADGFGDLPHDVITLAVWFTSWLTPQKILMPILWLALAVRCTTHLLSSAAGIIRYRNIRTGCSLFILFKTYEVLQWS